MSLNNGLAYSESDEGGHCKYCSHFGQSLYSVSNLESRTFVTKPLTNLNKASDKLREHFVGIGNCSAVKYHQTAPEKAVNFIAMMEKNQLPINQQLSFNLAQCIEKNRKMLKSIANAVILCGRQGIALHEHRDNRKNMEYMPHANHGNFFGPPPIFVITSLLNTSSLLTGLPYTRVKQHRTS